MNLKDMGFKFAFTIESYLGKEVKADPTYVKYVARFVKMDDGVVSEKILSYHKCNETDWKEFAPAAKGSKGLFETMRDDPKRGFFCIDWPEDEPALIYGDTQSNDYQYVDINLVPCNYVHAEFGETGDYIREECKSDLESQLEYLGNLSVITYATTQVF